MASPTQRDRRTWFLAWLPLFLLVYTILNGGGYFRAVYARMGMGDALPLPVSSAIGLLGFGWGLPALLVCLMLPYGTWMCFREWGRLRTWAAGGVFLLLLLLLLLVQWVLWLPFQGGMWVVGDDGKAVRGPVDSRILRRVVLETWRPHWGRPPSQEDLDALKIR